jgi:hypothetical protein
MSNHCNDLDGEVFSRRRMRCGVLIPNAGRVKLHVMGRTIPIRRRMRAGFEAVVLLAIFGAGLARADEAPAAAVSVFNAYVAKVEARLAKQHRSPATFLVAAGSDAKTDARIERGELVIEKLTPEKGADPPGGLLHDWRGTAFVQGATAADFERLMKDFDAYPRVYAPQVMQARILSPQTRPVPDHFTAMMRVQQKHVITVVMDTTYDITYGRLDAHHGYSLSRSTKISEISGAGTTKEHALTASEEHGFLWRLNTYWSYEERDGGLYMQIESISLTRGIPTGLGWVIRPYIESVPRESLEFTLRATSNALRK